MKKSKNKALNIILLLLGILLIAAGIGYLVIANYFASHFLPGTTVNGINCEYKDAQETSDLLYQKSLSYQLEVIGQDGDVLGTVEASQIGFVIDVYRDVEQLLRDQERFEWIFYYWNRKRSYDLVYGVSFDEEKLYQVLDEWEALQPENMEEPRDAYLSEYEPENKGYVLVEETRGSKLDPEKVHDVVKAAVQTGTESVNLEEAGCYVRASVTTQDPELRERWETLNRLTAACITYDWNGTEVVLDGDTIHEWIVEENGTYSLDEDAVAEFVSAQAKEYDTYGKKRKFKTTLGETLTLPSGGYGWKTNRTAETEELLVLLEEGAVTDREPVYSIKAFHKGEDDIGSSYVEIDLTNQHLYLYVDGAIVLESDLVSGNVSKGHTTPAGVFGLTYKTTDAVLRGDDYETPVKYWMPFNGNIGMHDATWRKSFGGDIYLTNGSHGCVNLPLSAAKEIYSYVSTGFPVICYYY